VAARQRSWEPGAGENDMMRRVQKVKIQDSRTSAGCCGGAVSGEIGKSTSHPDRDVRLFLLLTATTNNHDPSPVHPRLPIVSH